MGLVSVTTTLLSANESMLNAEVENQIISCWNHFAAAPHKSSFVALMKEKHGSNDFFVFVCVVLDAKSKSNGSIGRRRRKERRTGRPMIQGETLNKYRVVLGIVESEKNLATSNPEEWIILCQPSPPPPSPRPRAGSYIARQLLPSVRSAWLFYLRAEQIKKNYFSLPLSSLASWLSSYRNKGVSGWANKEAKKS